MVKYIEDVVEFVVLAYAAWTALMVVMYLQDSEKEGPEYSAIAEKTLGRIMLPLLCIKYLYDRAVEWVRDSIFYE